MPAALKSGSCAIGGCEPCQVGNQAALSNFSNVPRGSLLRAECTEFAQGGGSILRCMVLFYSPFYFIGKGDTAYASGIVSQMETAGL